MKSPHLTNFLAGWERTFALGERSNAWTIDLNELAGRSVVRLTGVCSACTPTTEMPFNIMQLTSFIIHSGCVCPINLIPFNGLILEFINTRMVCYGGSGILRWCSGIREVTELLLVMLWYPLRLGRHTSFNNSLVWWWNKTGALAWKLFKCTNGGIAVPGSGQWWLRRRCYKERYVWCTISETCEPNNALICNQSHFTGIDEIDFQNVSGLTA